MKNKNRFILVFLLLLLVPLLKISAETNSIFKVYFDIDDKEVVTNYNVSSSSCSYKTIHLNKGEKYELKFEAKPKEELFSKMIGWESTNPSVVEIDEGGGDSEVQITGLNQGESCIILSVGSQTEKITIEVDEESSVKVTDFDISVVPTNMYVGEKVDLSKVKVIPSNASNKTIKITSDNTSVLSVENNYLVAKKAGYAFVTFEADGVSTTRGISVQKPSVTGISFDKTTLNLKVGESDKLYVTHTPVYVLSPIITWSSTNMNVVTVDEDGHVFARGIGTATIKATAVNGLITECTVTVTKVAYLKGDLNKNGYIELTDVLKMLKMFFKSINYTTEEKNIGDMDGNNIIDLTDVLLLLKEYFKNQKKYSLSTFLY